MKFIYGAHHKKQVVAIILENEPEKALDLTSAASALNVDFPSNLLEAIGLGDRFVQSVEDIRRQLREQDKTGNYTVDVESLELLAPIPRPAKNIFCVGKNYLDHALELGTEADVPEVPMIFSKAPTTVIGPEQPIIIPTKVSTDIDYEGELAVVIGKKGKGITREEAYDYVFGYTLINDITARDLQSKHKQFLLGKSLDTSCPMGPALVHKSAVADPHDLHIITYVNGEIRQSSSTAKMIFSIPELIKVLSKGMTLEPGDIIATGTPAGVGKGFNPPKYLKADDVVVVEVKTIGALSNPVRNDV
ncbi:fumarylacetoacetate hydrolase family protein [Pseudalkalibacillus salsuginis]|uniref:fumarylacetoacetate hydrolase family protein n=1 Tax=Pseudalkalibacillus salsuginis TaxID=2910972 RepID=UPI001F1D3B3C|nr:fumarylacetoacetate hydrolase family protein [Pseudalkalibacillus salsuginis]MCF6409266.1 fumarylacetoacetate hydrolase family protein [Pseudalkalibacillus salsuginis]